MYIFMYTSSDTLLSGGAFDPRRQQFIRLFIERRYIMLILCLIIAIAIGVISGSPLLGVITFIFGLASMGNNAAHSAKKKKHLEDPDYIYYDDL